MTTWESVETTLATGPPSGRFFTTGDQWASEPLGMGDTPAPVIMRGGSTALPTLSETNAGLILALTGRTLAGTDQDVTKRAQPAGRVHLLTGNHPLARFLQVSKVYRTGDRITYAGYALDLAGQPLKQVQVQFIGETVQDNFAGSGTDLNGIFVAYLPTGDTYQAYAFSPKTGITWALERIVDHANSVTMEFRQVTKRGGFGEGIFLGSY